MTYLKNYFTAVPEEKRTPAAIAYFAALDAVGAVSPQVASEVVAELRDQRTHLKLIASENFSSLAVQLAMGNLLTDKYAEGVAGRRFYAGCEHVDAVEAEAADLAKQLFRAEHAYVQPHSGADANLVAFWAILTARVQPRELEGLGKKSLDELSVDEHERLRRALLNQKIMGMALGSGGHLTHGYRHNISSKFFQATSYEVDPETGLLDYAHLRKQVQQERPLILIAGYSAYPRRLNFAVLREIAEEVGAVLMVDMAHFAGLVAGKVFTGEHNPIPYAHVVTTTTHKTLRGPRGGMVLCTAEFREAVDRGCPLVLGGPLPHVMAAKAVAFREALRPEFQGYASKVVENAQAMAAEFMRLGARVLTGGTDNHLLLVDVAGSFGLTGRQVEGLLRGARLTVNRNAIPRDPNGAWYTSGIRLGTPATTTLGMGMDEMREMAEIVVELCKETRPDPSSRAKVQVADAALDRARKRVAALLHRFPLYPELAID